MRHLGLLVVLASCAGDPSFVQVELSPSVISSLDGRTTVSAIVSDGDAPLPDTPVRVSVAYRDRNGIDHAIDPIDGVTDARGVFHATIDGLVYDGAGTVTVEATGDVFAEASFSVLDRTPPTIEILSPTTNNIVGPGLPLDVQIRVTDEIGVSQVFFDRGELLGSRSTVVASGATETTLTFRMAVAADLVTGATVELHALARDLSGNFSAAAPITLTVDDTITIATPPGLTGTQVATGSNTQLVAPRAIAWSAMDGHLYVADQAQVGACDPSCIWRVDPATGTIDAAPVVVGAGQIEGLAFDATAENLYFTDRQNRTGRLTWDGTRYTSALACNDPNLQRPQDPMHVVFDPAMGLLTPDSNDKSLIGITACAPTTAGTRITASSVFETPRGIALGPAGEIYVSDSNTDRISQIDRTTGAVTVFSSRVREPGGIEWLDGASAFASSLLATSQNRTVESTTATSAIAVTYLRNTPTDIALDGTTLYILTVPSFNDRARIYRVTGF